MGLTNWSLLGMVTAIADFEWREEISEEMEREREGEKGDDESVSIGGKVWKCNFKPTFIMESTNEFLVIFTQFW